MNAAGSNRCSSVVPGFAVSPSQTVAGLASEERVAVHLEVTSLALSERATEGVDRWSDLDVNETGVFEHRLPTRTGQPSGNSAGPEIDVSQRLGWYGATIGDVSELQPPAGAQHAVDLGEDCLLVGAEVDHTVGDHHIGPSGFDRQ